LTKAAAPKKRKPAASVGALSRAARDKKIVEGRLQKKTLRELADEFSLSVGRVHAVLARESGALVEDTRELATEYRAKQLEQLEQVMAKWLPRVLDASAGAPELQALIKAMGHEAQLTGAFAATKTELTGADGGAVQVEQTVNLGALSLEELQQLEALQQKTGAA